MTGWGVWFDHVLDLGWASAVCSKICKYQCLVSVSGELARGAEEQLYVQSAAVQLIKHMMSPFSFLFYDRRLIIESVLIRFQYMSHPVLCAALSIFSSAFIFQHSFLCEQSSSRHTPSL